MPRAQRRGTQNIVLQFGNYEKYVLVLLWLLYVNNQWARYILTFLFATRDIPHEESFNSSASLSSMEYGVLVGFGFTLTFSVFAMCANKLATLHSRKNLLMLATLIWNGAIAFMATSHRFGNVLFSRLILGLGQAFFMPVIHSFLLNVYPPESMATVHLVLNSAIPMGLAISSLSVPIVYSIGWRDTCYAVMYVGCIVAAIFGLTVKEPQRIAPVRRKILLEEPRPVALSMQDAYREIRQERGIWYLLASASARFISDVAIAAFTPLFFMVKHRHSFAAFGVTNAVCVLGGSYMATALRHRVFAFAQERGHVRPALTYHSITCVVGIIAVLWIIYASTFGNAMVGLFVYYLVAEDWYTPFMATYRNSLSENARSFGINFFGFVTSMIGSAGAVIIGAAIDATSAESNAFYIEIILFISVLVALGVSSACAWVSGLFSLVLN